MRLLLLAAAFAWPHGAPTSAYQFKSHGFNLTCAIWETKTTLVMNCPIDGGNGLPWPPGNAKPVRSWKTKLRDGVAVTCRQFNAADNKTGKFLGAVAYCTPSTGSFVA